MVLAVHHIDEIVRGDQQLVRHVELARVGARSASHSPEIEPFWNEHRIATTESEEVLALCREAVNPVLTIPIRDEDVAVGRFNRVGRHVKRLAIGALLTLGANRKQHLAGRRVFGDGVEAGIGQINLASRVDPDAMRRGGQVAPAADLVPIPVEYQHVPNAAQDVADRAVLARVADPGVDPSPRVDADIRNRAADSPPSANALPLRTGSSRIRCASP